MAVEKSFSVSLDVKRSVANREIEVVEGDNGNIIEVTLTDNGQPVELAGCRVLAVFSKSNGTSLQDSAAEGGGVTIDENRVRIALFTPSFAPGMVECELQVYSGEALKTLVTTAKFNFKCRRGIFNDDTAQATNEYPLLLALIGKCEALETGLAGLTAEENARQEAEAGRAARDAAYAVLEAYDALRAYLPLNKVVYDGSTYQCIAPTTGNLPTNALHWRLIAQRGADGQCAGDMLKDVYDKNGDGVVDRAADAATVNGHTVQANVPVGLTAALAAAQSHAENLQNPHAVTAAQAGAAEALHAHGALTAQGAIGSTPSLPVFTGAGGALQTETAAAALSKLGVAYGTADMTAGTSPLSTGALYFVYE